ncbi:hypothetical protein ACIPZ8_15955 [Pseudomonas sp. NPDC089422]|uniref:hypothetical protein n=1 Tax=Pseudomonas sp. NPDC089422 TaxID=3364466 RepID=UPI0038115DF6
MEELRKVEEGFEGVGWAARITTTVLIVVLIGKCFFSAGSGRRPAETGWMPVIHGFSGQSMGVKWRRMAQGSFALCQ